MGDDASGVAREDAEQIELGAGEGDVAAVEGDAPGGVVDAELAEGERPGLAVPPEGGLDAGDGFGRGERPDDVVGRAALASRLLSTCPMRRGSTISGGRSGGRSTTVWRPPPVRKVLRALSTSGATLAGSGATTNTPVQGPSA